MLSHLFHHPSPSLQDLQSPNGHARERGLRQLTHWRKPPDLASLRAVLLRLNDWVPQVRAAAEDTLQAWWPNLSPTAMLACMDTLEAVARGQRADQRLLKRLRDRVLAADDPGAFKRLQGLVLGRTQAVFAWQLLRQHGALPDADLLQLGLRSENAWVASQAARVLSRWWVDGSGYADADQKKSAEGAAYRTYLTLMAEALTHRQSSVRAQALRGVPEGWRTWPMPAAQTLDELLRMSLFDRNASVRYLAVLHLGESPEALSAWVVAQFEEANAHIVAWHRLAQGPTRWLVWLGVQTPAAKRLQPWVDCERKRAGALQLLADLGQADAHGAVRAALASQVPSVRCAAHVAALRMGLLSPAQAVAQALQDPAPSVFNCVWAWCKRSKQWPSRSELQALGVLDADRRPARPDPRVQRMLANLDPWEALLMLLRLPMAETAQGESWYVGRAGEANAWLRAANRRIQPPTARQLADIRALLAAGQTGAFSRCQAALRFVLEGL